MHFRAYLVTNTINHKQYVGITTKSLRRRWNGHVCASRAGSQSALHRAIRKYGEESFTIEQIASAKTWDDLINIETALIAQHGTYNPGGYNLTKGGEGALGFGFTEEQLERLSASHKGIRHSDEAKAKIAAASRGRLHTEESLAKLSAAAAARWKDPSYRANGLARLAVQNATPEHRLISRENFKRLLEDEEFASKWRNGHTGFKHSEEAKRKMSEAKRGKILSPEGLAKLIAANKGRPKTAAEKAKYSEAKKKWWAARKMREATPTPAATPPRS